MTSDIQQLIARNSTPEPMSGCWLWTGEIINTGYGRLVYKGQRQFAHRASYAAHVGDVGDKFVLHRCDTPCCVNPRHLFLGTQADNMQDKVRKGRHADRHNEKHPMVRLNNEHVLAMRAAYAAGVLQREIAERFGVTQSHVSRVVRGHLRRGL